MRDLCAKLPEELGVESLFYCTQPTRSAGQCTNTSIGSELPGVKLGDGKLVLADPPGISRAGPADLGAADVGARSGWAPASS